MKTYKNGNKICEKCPISASYGDFCFKHRIKGSISKYHKYCQHKDCKRIAYYGYTEKLYCRYHRLDDMLDLHYHKLCEKEGCKNPSSFNFPGEKTKIFCFLHYLEGMVEKTCLKCDDLPIFGFPKSSPKYCKKHSHPGMINVVKTCLSKKCDRNPVFGIDGERIYCYEHRNEKCELLIKSCQERRCYLPLSYNFPDREPKFCSQHKVYGMIKCETVIIEKEKGNCKECNLKATHGYPSSKIKVMCKNHKIHGMENLCSSRCLICNKKNLFQELYCRTHLLEIKTMNEFLVS